MATNAITPATRRLRWLFNSIACLALAGALASGCATAKNAAPNPHPGPNSPFCTSISLVYITAATTPTTLTGPATEAGVQQLASAVQKQWTKMSQQLAVAAGNAPTMNEQKALSDYSEYVRNVASSRSRTISLVGGDPSFSLSSFGKQFNRAAQALANTWPEIVSACPDAGASLPANQALGQLAGNAVETAIQNVQATAGPTAPRNTSIPVTPEALQASARYSALPNGKNILIKQNLGSIPTNPNMVRYVVQLYGVSDDVCIDLGPLPYNPHIANCPT